MTDTSSSPRLVALGSAAPPDYAKSPAVRPTAFAAPARFLDLPQAADLALLSELAAQLLQDPLAMQQLSDRVVELLHQDLQQQRERNFGYGGDGNA